MTDWLDWVSLAVALLAIFVAGGHAAARKTATTLALLAIAGLNLFWALT